MARSMALVWGSGTTLLLVALVVHNHQEANVLGIVAVAAAAYVFAAIMGFAVDVIAQRVFEAIITAGNFLVASLVLLSGDPESFYALFYLWQVIHAAYFLPPKRAAFQVGVAALTYAVALAVLAGGLVSHSDNWLMLVGTLIAVGTVVAVLRRRLEGLVARLTELARRDPLTDLVNRRGFDEALELEVERAQRSGQPVSVIACDLDHFKRVNDGLGHEEGDRALERVAAVLESSRRGIDTVARIGGEEFAIIAVDTDANGAHVVAERVRREVHEAFDGELFPLTASLGIATTPDHAAEPDTLMRAADQALYAAKELGRDRSVIYSPDLPPTSRRERRGGSAGDEPLDRRMVKPSTKGALRPT